MPPGGIPLIPPGGLPLMPPGGIPPIPPGGIPPIPPWNIPPIPNMPPTWPVVGVSFTPYCSSMAKAISDSLSLRSVSAALASSSLGASAPSESVTRSIFAA